MAKRSVDKDYYGILQVPSDASEEEIRKAYRRLAFTCHPDRNQGDPRATERFKDISEAYAVLIDPGKRRLYDASRQTGTPGGFAYSQQDLFRDLFSDPRASAVFDELAREFERMGMRVDRHFFRQTLFEGRTVVTGGIFIVSPLTPVFTALRLLRAAVRGAGAASVEATGNKSLPGASGLLSAVGRLGRWLLGSPAQAEHKDVTLPLNLTRTEAQRGGGKRLRLDVGGRAEDLLVTIPPGVESGAKLRLRGKGAGPEGSRGDLYLAIEVQATD